VAKRSRKYRNPASGAGGGAQPPASSPPDTGSAGLRLLPGWAPVVLYSVLALFMFREFVLSDRMLLGTDTLSLGFMARKFFADALTTTGFPLWNPNILGGTPFLESVAGGDSLYPTSVLLLFMETYRALGWKLVLHIPLAGSLMYLWTRSLGRSQGASLLAGLAFTLAPYMVTLVYPAQDGKLFVTALTPLVFWTTDRLLRTGGLRWVGALALSVGLVILTTHFQMAYFLFGAVGAMAAFRTVQHARGTGPWAETSAEIGRAGAGRAGLRFGVFLAAAVLGAGVAAVQLMPSVNYVMNDSRRTATTTEAAGETGLAYASSWSLHPEEALSFVIPEFAGNSAGGRPWASDTYWGRNVFKLNHEYMGLVVLVLAGLAFLGAPQRGFRWFLLGMGGVVFLFTLGTHTPVWRVFYSLVPGVDLFRAPSMAIFLTGFASTTLMAFGVDRGLELALGDGDGQKRLMRYLGAWVGAMALLALLVTSGLLLDLWTGVLYSDIAPGKADALARATPFIRRGAFLALLLVSATGGAFWAISRRFLPLAAGVAALAGLVTLDLARVDAPFLQTLDYFQWAEPDTHEQTLMAAARESEEPFRVLSMLQSGQDVRPGMFGIELAAGHHPNDLARYREVIGMVGSGVPRNFFDQAEGGLNQNLFALLNIRFLLWPDYQYGALPVEPMSRLTTRDGQPYTSLYELPWGLPRARLVSGVRVVAREDAVATLLRPDFDPVAEVLREEDLDPSWAIADGGAPAATGVVQWVERQPDRMVLNVTTDRAALLALSQNWLPGWRARVDGEDRPVLRANHTLQAIPIPAGEHRIEIEYAPDPVRQWLWISILCLFVAGGLWAGGGMLEQRIARSGAPQPAPEIP